MRALKATLAALTLAFFATWARADAVLAGNLFPILDAAGDRIGVTIDYIPFTVNIDGTVTIDILSWEQDSADFDGDGDTLETFDVNGDGEIAFFDPMMHLFVDDGSLDAADLLATVDDSGDTFGDGSIFGFDSFLSIDLLAGDYLLALSAYFFEEDEALAGFNEDDFYPVTVDPDTGDLIPNDHGDYQVTFTGDVTVTGAIPEPASLAMCGMGVLGVAALARRRARNA